MDKLPNKHFHNRRGKRTTEYTIWACMKDRCLNTTGKAYRDYGARGIQVYQPWIESFSQFLTDVGPRPHPSLSLERIDNSCGYFPGNVRWATRKEQANNRRSCHLIAWRGEELNIAQLAERAGLNRKTVQNRIRLGWSAKLLGAPLNVKKRNGNARPL